MTKRRSTKRSRENVPTGSDTPTASSLLVVVDPRPVTRQSLIEMLTRALPDFDVIAAPSSDGLMNGLARPQLKPGLVLINQCSGGVAGE